MKKKIIVISLIALAVLVAAGATLFFVLHDPLPSEGDCTWTSWTTDEKGRYGQKSLFKRRCLECGNVQEYSAEPCEHIVYQEDNDGNWIVKGIEDCNCAFMYILSFTPDGEAVKTIGEAAFLDNSTVKFIYVESGVTLIENAAFAGCISLLSSTLPDSVEHMDGLTYYQCDKLYAANIPEGVSVLGEFTFGGCVSLRVPQLHSRLVELEEGCFLSCTGFESVILPENIKKLGKLVFAGCENLKILQMPGVEGSLEREVLSGCVSLREFVVPRKVDTILSGAFLNCSGLEKLYIGENVLVLEYEEGESPFANCDENKLTVYCEADKPPKNWIEGYDICDYYEFDDEKIPVRVKFEFGVDIQE